LSLNLMACGNLRVKLQYTMHLTTLSIDKFKKNHLIVHTQQVTTAEDQRPALILERLWK
jgi:hypothetical protein